MEKYVLTDEMADQQERFAKMNSRAFDRSILLEPLEARQLLSVSITRSLNNTMSVSSTFNYFDSTGTILTDVIITASESYLTTNGKTTYGTPLVDLSYSVANLAGGYFVTVAEASTTTPKILNIDPDLKTAHLVADVQLLDLNGIVYTPHVDIYWHATDPVQSMTTKTFSIIGPGVAMVEKVTGEGDDAIAAGTLSVPATSAFSAVPNATPMPTNGAVIQKAIDGTTTITVSLPPKIIKLLQSFSGTPITLDGPDLLEQLTGM